eukprot:357274-Chlamydomonas_euryale.AAC.2
MGWPWRPEDHCYSQGIASIFPAFLVGSKAASQAVHSMPLTCSISAFACLHSSVARTLDAAALTSLLADSTNRSKKRGSSYWVSAITSFTASRSSCTAIWWFCCSRATSRDGGRDAMVRERNYSVGSRLRNAAAVVSWNQGVASKAGW